MTVRYTSNGPRDLIVFGTGKAAQSFSYYLDHYSDYRIVAYAVDRAFKTMDDFNDKPVVAWEDLEASYTPDDVQLMGPFSFARLNQVRKDRFYEGKARGYRFASFIHPNNDLMTDKIGEHCVILERNVIEPYCEIGDNSIIWGGNHIGHHSVLGKHSFMSAMIGIAGGTIIGDECYMSGKTGIGHAVTIGHRCAMLNAASVVQDLPDDTVIVGQRSDIKPFPSSRILHLL